jgi:molybdopterin-guanine dinucleotide biosynthesis protein MobB
MRRLFVLSVLGLKDSGKTTLACGLIAGLGALGVAVAGLKKTHVPTLTLDAHGTDSSALWEAGARFVAVRSRFQTMTLERHPAEDPARELLDLVPPSVALVVAEGFLPPGPESPRVIVCLRRLEELGETLAVRGIRPGEVLALGGVAAAGAPAEAAGNAAAGPPGAPPAPGALPARYPIFDIRRPASAEALCRLVLATAGIEAPAPRPPSGP